MVKTKKYYIIKNKSKKKFKTKNINKLKKKHKTNITYKTYKTLFGGDDNHQENNSEKEGIIDKVNDKLKSITDSGLNYISNKGLKLLGLEKINKNEINENQNLNKINDVINKSAINTVDKFNKILEQPETTETLNEVTNKTLEIGKSIVRNLNNKLEQPEFKKETQDFLNNVSDYSEIALKSMDKPIDEVINKLNESGKKATSATVSGAIRVGTDAMAAVPGIGSIIEVGKMLNDGSKAMSSIVEAGSEAVEAGSEFFIETKKNVEKQLDKLEQIKKEKEEILNRTNNSIQKFNQMNGGGRWW